MGAWLTTLGLVEELVSVFWDARLGYKEGGSGIRYSKCGERQCRLGMALADKCRAWRAEALVRREVAGYASCFRGAVPRISGFIVM